MKDFDEEEIGNPDYEELEKVNDHKKKTGAQTYKRDSTTALSIDARESIRDDNLHLMTLRKKLSLVY